MVILILLNSFPEKESSIPLVIQFSVFYGCSAEKSIKGVQLFNEIELHPEISIISLFEYKKHVDDKKELISRLGTHAWANRSTLVHHFISSARKKVARGF